VDKKKAAIEIADLFVRTANKYRSLERHPVRHGGRHALYHSERHMIDKIGDHPGMNITEFAETAGVTKGAVSQIVAKLERKGVVRRYKKTDNDKEVLIELTKAGKDAYLRHRAVNEETMAPLFQELKKHPDDKVEYLIEMFKWIDGFLDSSKKRMEAHAKEGR
jgi:DNA-binding MarR family transcriptional regulator